MLPLPLRRLAGEHVGAGVVDPHVDPAELVVRPGHQALARVARREIGLADERAAAARRDRVGDLARTVGGVAVREQHDGSLGRICLGDGAADPAARAGDDGVQALQTDPDADVAG